MRVSVRPGLLMKIILVGNYRPDEQESMLRYQNLVQMGLADVGIDVLAIQPSPILGWLPIKTQPLRKWIGYFDKFIIFPFILSWIRLSLKGGHVMHICDQGNALWIPLTSILGPTVITCHDVLAIQSALGLYRSNRTSLSGRMFQRLNLISLKRSDFVICVSNTTRISLARNCERHPRVSVVYNALNHPFIPIEKGSAKRSVELSLREKGIPGINSYILHVGGNQWYKNRLGVLSAYKELLTEMPNAPALVMIGKPFSPEMVDFYEANCLRGRVFEIVGVNSFQLNCFYSGAECLLFPSLAEGFGWPIIEALASGCLVVSSNRPPMTEVGGVVTFYCDPEDCSSIVKKVCEVLSLDEWTREKTRLDGLAHARRFSTSVMTDALIDTYKFLEEICSAEQNVI